MQPTEAGAWCACGCGRAIDPVDAKGRPRRFLHGHNAFNRRPPPPPRVPVRDRFWQRVDKSGDCWLWIGARQRSGYGSLGGEGRRTTAAHRVAWELTYGPIPAGVEVCHRCDNPPCCRPDHLFLGTRRDNVADMVRKGRGRYTALRGEANGHSTLTEDDVRLMRDLRASGVKLIDLAARFGIDHTTVSSIVRRKTWAHVA